MPGRRLNDVELDAYDVLPADAAREVRIVDVPALPGGYAGLTVGSVVLLSRPVPADGTSVLLAHELVHVRQWRELGAVGFALRYLGSFLRAIGRHRRWQPAYRDISLEQQARAEVVRWRERRAGGVDRSGPEGGEALP